jgi:hypothetical protein
MTPVNGKAAGTIDVFCDEAATGCGYSEKLPMLVETFLARREEAAALILWSSGGPD